MIRILDKVLDVPFENEIGSFLAGAYVTEETVSGVRAEHMLLYLHRASIPCLLRINSACFTADIFGEQSCDCSWQLYAALTRIQRDQQGLLIYHLHHEGRGRGIVNKLRELQGKASRFDIGTSGPAESRTFLSATVILKDLGITSVRLMSNSPQKQRALENEGIVVVERIPVVHSDQRLDKFYEWKRRSFGHEL